MSATSEFATVESKSKLEVAKSELAVAKVKLAAAKSKLAAAKSELAAAKSELAAAKSELAAAEGKLAAAEGKLAAAKSEEDKKRAQEFYDVVFDGFKTSQSAIKTAQSAIDAAQALVNSLIAPALPSGPRSFWIRHWVGADVSCKQFELPEDYDDFRRLLVRAFNFPLAAKVYYFPGDDISNLAHRVPVNSSTAFETFLSFPRKAQPLLYLWKRDQVDSPDLGPADQADAKSQTAESDTSRGSVQTVWSNGVKNTDGWKCVVCASSHSKNLIGAHIIPVAAPKEALLAAELPSPYECRNVVTMCVACSGLYDNGFFYFDQDGTIHVSGALQEPEWKAREGTKIFRSAQRTEVNWPSKPIIEYRKAYYLDHQKKRHNHCGKCDHGYKKQKNCVKHEAGCQGSFLKTPAKQKEESK